MSPGTQSTRSSRREEALTFSWDRLEPPYVGCYNQHAGGRLEVAATGHGRTPGKAVPARNFPSSTAPRSDAPRSTSAFTLLELLVVIVIIGLLAAIGIPAMRGMSKSNAIAAADRQMLDDIAYARQRAIADHTTVYVVFVPPWIVNTAQFPTNDPIVRTNILRLYGGQYTTYAMLSLRLIGDQPGRATPRYLTGWRTLPEGSFIPSNKFLINFTTPFYPFTVTNFATGNFPFPFVTNNTAAPYALPGGVPPLLPYIAFDYLGHLTSQRDETIPLAHGSILYARDANGNFVNQPADVQELPPTNTIYSANYPNNSYNQVHIDWLTGRARIEKPEIQ